MSEAIEQHVENMMNLNETETIEKCKKCGEVCDPYDKPTLRCSGGCGTRIHTKCLKRGSIPVSFVGDVFFELNCASCNPLDEETVVRDRMPWLNVIVLTLYNLRERSSGISKRGYFHWKSDISIFVERNWDYLFKKTVKKKKNWMGTISGTLSHYSGIFFKSGTNELGESGWWKLSSNDPPECHQIPASHLERIVIVVEKYVKIKAPLCILMHMFNQQRHYPIFCWRKMNQMVNHRNHKKQIMLISRKLYFLDMNIEDDIILGNGNDVLSISDLIRDCQNDGNNFHLTQLMDNCDWLCDTSTLSPSYSSNEIKTIKEKGYKEDNNDGLISIQEPPASLFKETKRRQRPWFKSFVTYENITRVTPTEEMYLLQSLGKTDLDKAPPAIRRLYRKLAVRKTKREYRLALLDVDCFESKSKISTLLINNNRILDRFFSDDQEYTFEQRLQGYNEPTFVHSPYTGRLLKPFIRRDIDCQPLWLKIMEELCTKVNRNDPRWKLTPRATVDYSYIKPQHIPAINSLCNQFFWPGIDLTECLQYPDFTCVVLYKKLVIGFAILVPYVGHNEAYISFLLTRPEWRKSGIGMFMLYHLIQTCMGQDVTLHVSATNPALILYQKFGFKVEEFVQDFYDKYAPPNSRECKHALFLRLSR
ncbi:hypothetical protein P5V15_009233 [Pogonomyrmex californicus]